jgi:hypothetical protein
MSHDKDRTNPHYIPAAALKRFANDLGNEGPNKFLQINRERVTTFIEKPYTDTKPLKASSLKATRKMHVPGINEYNLDKEETSSFLHLQNLPCFKPELGARSRFGDGDGSFFDRWLNSDFITSAKVLDKDGLPVMK